MSGQWPKRITKVIAVIKTRPTIDMFGQDLPSKAHDIERGIDFITGTNRYTGELVKSEVTQIDAFEFVGLLYYDLGRYTEAELLFKQALVIRQNALGPDHPYIATSLDNYATLLREMGHSVEAVDLEVRAKAIRAKHAKDD